jgi:ComF family protein
MLARLARNAADLRNALLDLLFPPRCVACRRVGPWFCVSCCASIEKILPPLCNHCGRPSAISPCAYCAKQLLQIDGIRAVALFEGSLRAAIHAFKYQHRTELAPVFGTMLSEYLLTFPLPADTIVAVPLHADRERMRGFNQSLLLARTLGARLDLPVWEDGLTRTRATQSQTQLDAAGRRENVRDAFVAAPRARGARVLLIDDVCTTGATMDACSAALSACGAKSVWGLAIARAL